MIISLAIQLFLALGSVASVVPHSEQQGIPDLLSDEKFLTALYLDLTFHGYDQALLIAAIEYLKLNPQLIANHLTQLPTLYQRLCAAKGFNVPLYKVCASIRVAPLPLISDLGSFMPRDRYFVSCPPGIVRKTLFKRDMEMCNSLDHFWTITAYLHKSAHGPVYLDQWDDDVQFYANRIFSSESHRQRIYAEVLRKEPGVVSVDMHLEHTCFATCRIFPYCWYQEIAERYHEQRADTFMILSKRFLEGTNIDRMELKGVDPRAIKSVGAFVLPLLSHKEQASYLDFLISHNPLLLLVSTDWLGASIYSTHRLRMILSLLEALLRIKASNDIGWDSALEPSVTKGQLQASLELCFKVLADLDYFVASTCFQTYGAFLTDKSMFHFDLLSRTIPNVDRICYGAFIRSPIPAFLPPDIQTMCRTLSGNMAHGISKFFLPAINQVGPLNPSYFLQILLDKSSGHIINESLFLFLANYSSALGLQEKINVGLFLRLLESSLHTKNASLFAQKQMRHQRKLVCRNRLGHKEPVYPFDSARQLHACPFFHLETPLDAIVLIYSLVFRIGSFATADSEYCQVLESICLLIHRKETARALALVSLHPLRDPLVSDLFNMFTKHASPGEFDFIFNHYMTLSMDKQQHPRSFLHLVDDRNFSNFQTSLLSMLPFRYGQMTLAAIKASNINVHLMLADLKVLYETAKKISELTVEELSVFVAKSVQSETLNNEKYLISPTVWIKIVILESNMDMKFISGSLLPHFPNESKIDMILCLLKNHQDAASVDLYIQETVFSAPKLTGRVFKDICSHQPDSFNRFTELLWKYVETPTAKSEFIKNLISSPWYFNHLAALVTFSDAVVSMHRFFNSYCCRDGSALPVSIALLKKIVSTCPKAKVPALETDVAAMLHSMLKSRAAAVQVMKDIFPGCSALTIADSTVFHDGQFKYLAELGRGSLLHLSTAPINANYSCTVHDSTIPNSGAARSVLYFPTGTNIADLYFELVARFNGFVSLTDGKGALLLPSGEAIPSFVQVNLPKDLPGDVVDTIISALQEHSRNPQ